MPIGPLAFQLAQQGAREAKVSKERDIERQSEIAKQRMSQEFQTRVNQAAFENTQKAQDLAFRRQKEFVVFSSQLEEEQAATRGATTLKLKQQETQDAEKLRVDRNVQLAKSLKSIPNISEDFINFTNLLEAGLDPQHATFVFNNKNKLSPEDQLELNSRLKFVNNARQYNPEQLKDPLVRKQIVDTYEGKDHTYIKNYFEALGAGTEETEKPTAAMREAVTAGVDIKKPEEFREFLKGGKGGPEVSMQLRRQFQAEPAVKDFKDIKLRSELMNSAWEMNLKTPNKIAVDQAIITLFNKMQDAISVVRESEYARTQNDLSLLHRVQGMIQKGWTGGAGPTDSDRKALVNMGNLFEKKYSERYTKTRDFYKKTLAPEFSVNPVIFAIDESEGTEQISTKSDPLGWRK